MSSGIKWVLAACVLFAGCASYQNERRLSYLAGHPAMGYCFMEQGVDLAGYRGCVESRISDPQACITCSGPHWRAVEMCALAQDAQDRWVAQGQGPYYQANALGMIGLGAQIYQGRPAVNIYNR